MTIFQSFAAPSACSDLKRIILYQIFAVFVDFLKFHSTFSALHFVKSSKIWPKMKTRPYAYTVSGTCSFTKQQFKMNDAMLPNWQIWTLGIQFQEGFFWRWREHNYFSIQTLLLASLPICRHNLLNNQSVKIKVRKTFFSFYVKRISYCILKIFFDFMNCFDLFIPTYRYAEIGKDALFLPSWIIPLNCKHLWKFAMIYANSHCNFRVNAWWKALEKRFKICHIFGMRKPK